VREDAKDAPFVGIRLKELARASAGGKGSTGAAKVKRGATAQKLPKRSRNAG
jgi:hypothetical protein